MPSFLFSFFKQLVITRIEGVSLPELENSHHLKRQMMCLSLKGYGAIRELNGTSCLGVGPL